MRQGLLTAFVINLRCRSERWRAIEAAAREAQVDVERVDAIDTRCVRRAAKHWRNIDSRALERLQHTCARGFRETHDELTPGAVGCALSHVAVSREVLRRKQSLAAVFEDDAELPRNFHAFVAQALAAAPIGWDLILLGWSGAAPHECPALLQRVWRFWGLHAYLISARGCAELIAAGCPVSTHIDHALSARTFSNDLHIYGIAAQHLRLRQVAHGSDVHIPLKSASR
mmetsp:Transcript_8430/g.22195  ORF Transcript_8430/g.22195 Transcript_8430/m.22195 type:complete len:228 (+) Transcript_8430:144-827(+)|eukprot:CAMPEP_0185832096 /NCGR_PEP_ID=MMETSP1353-20130828/1887_1 /TAXON_ID=1077150 /ORGANISM="Erythrolobus australicus, Strain CCMP3124" /LENGTH=227 /DNA_ID=CAMNT_0028530237 /DNA_START=90 /DNA_END=773 /DNA_ORIENTATION=-